MTSPYKLTVLPRISDLEILEAHAKMHYQNVTNSWRLFVETCDEIRNSKLYLEKADNWTAYCRLTFNLSDSRIRQFRAAIPFAELIEEATAIVPTEAQVRNCRAAVGDDNLLLIPTFQAAIELAPNHAPQPRHFKAAYETLTTAQKTGAVTVGELSMKVTPQASKRAIQEAFIEADNRYKQHLADSNKKSEKWQGTVMELIERYRSNAIGLPRLDEPIILIWQKKEDES